MTYTAKVELCLEIDDKENRFPRDTLIDIMQDVPNLKNWRVIYDAFDGKRVMCDRCVHYTKESPESERYECEYGPSFVYECRFSGLKHKKIAEQNSM